jgi:hypothetical protein
MAELAAERWALHTFGRARLGDPRRVRRLVEIAAAVVRQPGGTVTATQRTAAAREGAFRFLESKRVDTKQVGEAVHETAALDCVPFARVFVVLDQTDLTFVDRRGVRGLGPVLMRNCDALRSAHVMNALALGPDGVPVGVLDQQWWIRPEERTPWRNGDLRPPQERESWSWVRSIEAVEDRLSRVAPQTVPWFVMDRGADFHGTLVDAVRRRRLVTVRSSYDRRIRRNGAIRWLWKSLARRPIEGHVDVQVPATSRSPARVARLEIRTLRAEVRVSGRPHPEVWGDLSCVRVREAGKVPCGQKPIEWKLLSTHPVEKFEDALLILQSYVWRWRIETFHRSWKTGACNVESSQLRSLDAITRWGTILAAVAARVERLRLLSRTQPDLCALEEFTQHELDAAIVLSETKRFEVGSPMTLAEAVRLVAMVGGYMGRKRDGPPGSITIRRGLERVLPAATAMATLRTSG